jgi:hypothetical protein
MNDAAGRQRVRVFFFSAMHAIYHRAIIPVMHQPRAFACENRRFKTNTEMGERHGRNLRRGSVYREPLIDTGGFTLWLEYVTEKQKPDEEWFWLMWYDREGQAQIPASSVFRRDDLKEMIGRLADLLPAMPAAIATT